MNTDRPKDRNMEDRNMRGDFIFLSSSFLSAIFRSSRLRLDWSFLSVFICVHLWLFPA